VLATSKTVLPKRRQRSILLKYIAKRIALFPIIVLCVITINFVLIHLAPGGPFQILLSNPSFTPKEVQTLEAEYGLNKPLYQQYLTYIFQIIFHGNFGNSYFYDIPVIQVIRDYLPNTLVLASFAIILSTAAGIILGVISARRGRYTDRLLGLIAILSYATPVFWVGVLLILIFSVYLRVLPSTGVFVSTTGFNLLDFLKHIAMPTFSLSLLLFPPIYFFTRSSLIEVMKAEFVKALYSKGLTESVVFWRHALRNALLPILTLVGLNATFLFGGATIVEIVFSWPGIGLMTYNAILNKDYPVLLASVFFFSLLVAGLNLVVDILYTVVDPRISLK
jgi:peptide/nickel transport system permease protein